MIFYYSVSVLYVDALITSFYGRLCLFSPLETSPIKASDSWNIALSALGTRFIFYGEWRLHKVRRYLKQNRTQCNGWYKDGQMVDGWTGRPMRVQLISTLIVHITLCYYNHFKPRIPLLWLHNITQVEMGSPYQYRKTNLTQKRVDARKRASNSAYIWRLKDAYWNNMQNRSDRRISISFDSHLNLISQI